MTPEGYYDGQIIAAHVEVDDKSSDGLVLVFDLRADGWTGTARQRTSGEWGHIGVEVLEHLGLEWPDGLEQIHDTVGKDVRVRVKHNEHNGKVYENWYIVTNSPKQIDPDELCRRIERIKAKAKGGSDDENIPF